MFFKSLASLATAAALALPAAAQTVHVDQGKSWTPALRDQFYTQDQGARIMPLAWMRALSSADGQPFLRDSLIRYGYLPMPGRAEADIPVGFTTNGSGAGMAIGMTCAACHTRQIEVSGTAYRLDGGPAIVDFQSFLKDLDEAVLAVLDSEDSFTAFAEKVLGGSQDSVETARLKSNLEVWSRRFHTLIERSLPDPAWGPARLDAVSMIFNRLAGLDIGPEENDFMIPDNIAVADAPVRYSFLWNATRQDFTQWPGFAANGNELLGLSRNLGEVYGVFADFRPLEQPGAVFNRDFISHNSANWEGLWQLERWIGELGAPQWPWQLNHSLAAQGKEVFNLATDKGGCVECHGRRKGEFRSLFRSTWATPVLDVGTDTRECHILTRTVQTGVLEGTSVPLAGGVMKAEEPAISVLGLSVIGAIVQHGVSLLKDEHIAGLSSALPDDSHSLPDLSDFEDLRKAFPQRDDARIQKGAAAESCKYESRVLDGIWAAAPYLHNGSVPTLADLLKPAAERPASFTPGPNYDIGTVGMAADQTMFSHVIETTGCDQLDSGNSRCGHEFGTSLSAADKKALLEYLKSI